MNSRSAGLLAGIAAAALLALGIFEWSAFRGDAAREVGSVDASSPRPLAQDSAAAKRGAIEAPAAGVVLPATERGDPESSPMLAGEVRVSFDSDQRPAAGADVYWLDFRRLIAPNCKEEFELLGMSRDFLSRNGRHFVSDAQGIARVPAASGVIQVVALTETHFGMTTLARKRKSAEPIAVALRPAFGIDVRVRSAGAQAPVPEVAVVAQCNLTWDLRIGGVTDSRGIARLWPLLHEDESRGRWYATVPGVFREELRVPFELQARSQPLEMTLPDSAPASVRIVDERGGLCPISGVLRLGWKDTDGDPVDPIEVRIFEGIARLARVESGLSVVVRATLAGTTETPMSEFTQARTGSAPAPWDLSLKFPIQRVRARFVDLTGATLDLATADCVIFIRQEAAIRSEGLAFTRRSDDSAEFFIAASQAWTGPCTLAVGVQTMSGTQFGGIFRAALDARVTELGDLRLMPPSRLFAGRALDGEGRAMKGASIEISQADDAALPQAFRALECTAGDAGEFEILGWAEPGPYELRAVGGGVIASAKAQLGDFSLELRGR